MNGFNSRMTRNKGRPKTPKSESQRKAAERNRKRQLYGETAYTQIRAEDLKRARNKKRKLGQEYPLGRYENKDLDQIDPIRLAYTSLDEAEPCQFCGALLFAEEKSRKMWCCGQGTLLFPKPKPLDADFYSNPDFLSNIRDFNNTFAFSALGVTGEFQKAPGGFGPCMVKIQGRTYHRLFDINWHKEGSINNSQLYIDDGSMRMAVAKKRSLDTKIVSEIEAYLNKVNQWTGVYKRLGSHPSDTAHIVFESTSRKTHGPVLGDSPKCGEIAAIIKTGNVSTNQPRSVTVWKIHNREPQFINILDPLYEPLQYPLIFPHASAGWYPGM